MQAHTLGEVGIFGTVLLRVSSGTILAIFIKICLYLEQKISWHSFFRHGIYDMKSYAYGLLHYSSGVPTQSK